MTRWLRVTTRTVAAGVCLATAAVVAAQEPAPSDGPTRVRASLVIDAVPEPGLEHLDPEVRRQFEQDRPAVAAALAGAVVEAEAQAAANAFADLCLRYLHYEFHGAASVCLGQLRALAPGDFQWAYYELLLYDATGDLERARASAGAALDLRPNDPPTLIRAGDLLLAEGELDAAEAAYGRAASGRPESAAARFGLGRAALDRGDAERAVQILEAVAATQPEGSIVRHHLGMALRAAGETERARTELSRNRQVPVAMADPLRERLELLGVKEEAVFDRAVRAARSGDHAQAIALYEQLLAANGRDVDVHFNLARSLIETGDHDRAEAHLRRALEIRPGHGGAHFNLALLLGRAGRDIEAGAHLERAADIDPENLSWQLMRARARAEAGDTGGAISELEKIVDLDPGMIDARQALAALLVGAGEPERAALQLEALVALTPDDLAARFNLGLMQFQAGRYIDCRATLEAALERFPEDVAMRHLLARLLATSPVPEARDDARAVELAQAVFSEQPGLDHLETLAMALAAAGRFDEAVSRQEEALESERQATGRNSPERRQRLEMYRAKRPVRAPARSASMDAGQKDAVQTSHQRMLGLLEAIRVESAEENPWLGEAPARSARALLAASADAAADRRFRLLIDLAEEELRLGNETAALQRFEEARNLMPELSAIPGPEKAKALFRMAVAYLRYGESRNCTAAHSAEACILPIRGGAIHREREGSEMAAQHLREYLALVPEDSVQQVQGKWLLNLVHMTLGDHPAGVEPQYRLPLAAFGSDADFPRFRNVAPELGVDTFNLSGGAVIDDFDGDADLDVFTTTFDPGGEPRFFRGDGAGGFEDATSAAGLEGLYGGLNVVQGDYDNDGDVDLYVLRGAWFGPHGRHPNSLLRNDSTSDGGSGEELFRDVTFVSGLGDAHYPTQTAAWADVDNDGDLDLFVGNEHSAGQPAPSQLFRNEGAGPDGVVRFRDVAAAAGLGVRAFVKAAVWGDYDNDRFPDLYVSVLGGANRLYRNRGDGSFEDVAAALGVTGPRQSFPAWFWDVDNDGNLDLFVSSYTGDRGGLGFVAASYQGLPGPWELARLYRGTGGGRFEDVAARAGLTRLHLPMGSNFGDLDGDGFLDFYLGTGYPDYEAVMPNVLYRSLGGERFVDVSLAAGFGHLQKGHAVVFADIDSDGDLDVFEQMGGAFPGDGFGDALFENPGFGNRWLGLRLVGSRSNRSAIGARVRVDVVDADGGRRSIHRRTGGGGSFGGNPLRQTIGLGRPATVEKVEIYWPTTDITQTFAGVEPDRLYRVVEGVDELEEME
ncbi:MAG: FG-GAP-like repeat-containing protein [Acidobacteria bacterium]|nr:FG-GAP-like repeat-containing protein [Acidobacteriota bacterium]